MRLPLQQDERVARHPRGLRRLYAEGLDAQGRHLQALPPEAPAAPWTPASPVTCGPSRPSRPSPGASALWSSGPRFSPPVRPSSAAYSSFPSRPLPVPVDHYSAPARDVKTPLSLSFGPSLPPGPTCLPLRVIHEKPVSEGLPLLRRLKPVALVHP